MQESKQLFQALSLGFFKPPINAQERNKQQQSRFRHCVSAPKRFLRRARDFYVDSMVSFDGKVSTANVMACPVASHLPNKFGQFSSTSTKLDDDELLKERYKLISKKYNWSSTEFDKINGLNERSQKGSSGYSGIDRSYSVALGKIGTIDEEEPCDFHEHVDMKSEMFMRSRSHAVTMKNGFYY
ncbi:hypothetical protein BUALT_Bualt03G0016900 [Buddleja alternifolia]|uniref:Uncharacterized protein n=1 Tax=Buddleja alternifolia TaxID=168488 RepID=A0AAV6XSL0_9LAMI|nr:hypothetical protein BUALT_Bualt03G0016900 [Buddleja alternifolia]